MSIVNGHFMNLFVRTFHVIAICMMKIINKKKYHVTVHKVI